MRWLGHRMGPRHSNPVHAGTYSVNSLSCSSPARGSEQSIRVSNHISSLYHHLAKVRPEFLHSAPSELAAQILLQFHALWKIQIHVSFPTVQNTPPHHDTKLRILVKGGTHRASQTAGDDKAPKDAPLVNFDFINKTISLFIPPETQDRDQVLLLGVGVQWAGISERSNASSYC